MPHTLQGKNKLDRNIRLNRNTSEVKKPSWLSMLAKKESSPQKQRGGGCFQMQLFLCCRFGTETNFNFNTAFLFIELNGRYSARSVNPDQVDRWILTQLDVADPHALFTFLQDLLKVNTGKPTGATRYQNCRHAHKLGACRCHLFLLGRRRLRGPLQTAEKTFDYHKAKGEKMNFSKLPHLTVFCQLGCYQLMW